MVDFDVPTIETDRVARVRLQLHYRSGRSLDSTHESLVALIEANSPVDAGV